MSKFKNIHSVSGKITFEGKRIEFNEFLETSNPKLIKNLENNKNWIKIKDKVKELKKFKNKIDSKDLEDL